MQPEHVHTPEQETLPPGGARSFNWFLSRIGNGAMVHELTNKLTDIGAALNQAYQDYRGKPKAKITITLTITNEKGVMKVDGDYDIRLPKPPAASAIMWTDSGNNFCEENPEQMKLFPRGPRAV